MAHSDWEKIPKRVREVMAKERKLQFPSEEDAGEEDFYSYTVDNDRTYFTGFNWALCILGTKHYLTAEYQKAWREALDPRYPHYERWESIYGKINPHTTIEQDGEIFII